MNGTKDMQMFCDFDASNYCSNDGIILIRGQTFIQTKSNK